MRQKNQERYQQYDMFMTFVLDVIKGLNEIDEQFTAQGKRLIVSRHQGEDGTIIENSFMVNTGDEQIKAAIDTLRTGLLAQEKYQGIKNFKEVRAFTEEKGFVELANLWAQARRMDKRPAF